MMRRQIITTLTVLVALHSFNIQALELSKHLATIVEPEPIKRVNPKYPINAARNNREGWAELSFIIEKDGSVSNVIANETSGSMDFTKAAKQAVMQWKYKPAMENGEPIQQCVNSIRMDFSMGNHATKGVSRRFKSKYEKAKSALEKQDYQRVEELLTDMEKRKNRHLSENNFMHTLAAKYAEAVNNKAKQLYHLNQIYFHEKNATEQYKLIVLNERFLLAIELNKFKLAFNSYNQLKELKAAEPYWAKYEQTIAKVDAFIDGDKDFIVDAMIKESDYWSYRLVRNEFSLTTIEGSLNKMDVRCENKRHVYTVENNNTWSIPSAWKNCSLYIYGDANTQFKLVEHPMKS